MSPDDTCERACLCPVEEKHIIANNYHSQITKPTISCIIVIPMHVKPLISLFLLGHFLLQTPPSGFLASQITASQWTKSYKKRIHCFCVVASLHTYLDHLERILKVVQTTWGLKVSLSSKENIWTSKRLKWEGFSTLASTQTGWKTTWYGCTLFAHLRRRKKKKLQSTIGLEKRSKPA